LNLLPAPFIRQPPKLLSDVSEASTTVLVFTRACFAMRMSISGFASFPRAMIPETSGADDDVPPNPLV
jgi:hypothetical protein